MRGYINPGLKDQKLDSTRLNSKKSGDLSDLGGVLTDTSLPSFQTNPYFGVAAMGSFLVVYTNVLLTTFWDTTKALIMILKFISDLFFTTEKILLIIGILEPELKNHYKRYIFFLTMG